jgi:hypothetical protein
MTESEITNSNIAVTIDSVNMDEAVVVGESTTSSESIPGSGAEMLSVEGDGPLDTGTTAIGTPAIEDEPSAVNNDAKKNSDILSTAAEDTGKTGDESAATDDTKKPIDKPSAADDDAKKTNDDPAAADDDAKKAGETSTKDDAKKASDSEPKKEKIKPRVLKETLHGIYTIQELEAANFFVEWYKGVRASAPFILRLVKTYFALSPSYSSLLVAVNILKAALPSYSLWVSKEFLDEVQSAADGKHVHMKKLLVLLVLRLLEQTLRQGLELVTYPPVCIPI